MHRFFIFLILLIQVVQAFGQDVDIYVCTGGGGLMRYDLPTRRFVETHPQINQVSLSPSLDIACGPDGTVYMAGADVGADYLKPGYLIAAIGTDLFVESMAGREHSKIGRLPKAIGGDICMIGERTAFYSAYDNHIYKLVLSEKLDELVATEDMGQANLRSPVLGLVPVKVTGCIGRDGVLCFSPNQVAFFDPATGTTELLSESSSQVLGAASRGAATLAGPDPDLSINNFITPNGDGINDKWTFSVPPVAEGFQIHIANRYGQQVYVGQDPALPWPTAETLPGVYYFTLSVQTACTALQAVKGWIEVVR